MAPLRFFLWYTFIYGGSYIPPMTDIFPPDSLKMEMLSFCKGNRLPVPADLSKKPNSCGFPTQSQFFGCACGPAVVE